MEDQFYPSLIKQRTFFETGNTRSFQFRKNQLLALKHAIRQFEPRIFDALKNDLGKSKEESFASEVGIVYAEITFVLKHLKKWMQPERVQTNLLNFPSSAIIYKDPLGVVCIIGAWNYPFNLVLMPLIGSIAGGNCSLLKPSEFAPATASVIKEMFKAHFNPEYINVVTGAGHEVIPAMMNSFRFDQIFYTGSTSTGKKIYEAAAKQLIPVTLEMGGKSPAVVDQTANIKVAAKRIVLGKFINAGQTCVAPDYVLAERSVKSELIIQMKKAIEEFYSNDPEKSEDYGRMVNTEQFERLKDYIDQSEVVFGGDYDPEKLYISPAIADTTNTSAITMKEEIFGPILPVIAFDDKADALNIIRQHKDPLAFYLFTNNRECETFWVESVRFGGGCINNTLWHLSHNRLPFGGIGASGIGNYHGRYSFDTFTHAKSVLRSPTWFDPKIKYPPLKGKMKWLRFFFR